MKKQEKSREIKRNQEISISISPVRTMMATIQKRVLGIGFDNEAIKYVDDDDDDDDVGVVQALEEGETSF